MSNRNQKTVYCFIYDRNKFFYRAKQSVDGTWTISSNTEMYPLRHNPKNLIDTPVEFSTNKTYFSMNRSINYPLDFTFDGAAILNSRYQKGKGFNEELYFSMFEFDGTTGKYGISYNGKFDFQQKVYDEKLCVFSVPVVDDSAWAILSQNEDVKYSIDCNKFNPKAIKVLFDGFVLRNRYTYQTVQSPIIKNNIDNVFSVPFVLVNQDGDSSGLITKSQSYVSSNDQATIGPVGVPPHEEITTGPNSFLETFYQLNNVNIQGSIKWAWSTNANLGGGIYWVFRTNKGQYKLIWTNQFVPSDPINWPTPQRELIPGKIYETAFNFNINLTPGEKISFLIEMDDAGENNLTVTPIVTNIFVSTNTTVQSTTCYALRPLDLFKELVNKATFGRYTIDSNYFTTNNKTVIISGQSLRGVDNAKIVTSFRDAFQSFDPEFFMALRNINSGLWMELADDVYGNQNTNIIDLGELIECSTYPAVEYEPNEIIVGSPKQDYRHPSGRLEFNDTVNWSLPFQNIKNQLNIVTKYRTDCFGAIFMILDYKGSSTQDNPGDNDNWMIQITDVMGSATEDIETFENITIDDAILAPIITHPLTGDVINNDKPTLRGRGIPGTTVNIYIADVFDGTTVVDVDGNWEYDIVTSLPSYDPGVFDGISVINATNTDMSGVLNTIQLIVNTTAVPDLGFASIKNGDFLYNNLPLVTGQAIAGTNIPLYLDGNLVTTVVTDNSCRWEYKFTNPIPNGNHTLRIDVAGPTVNFDVNAFTALPIITYIGAELDGFPIVNNLPLIRGVGTPGFSFKLWLNYLPYSELGTVTVDPNGDWSFQVVVIQYVDPVTNAIVQLTPIRNGLSVISTQLINDVVQVAVTGFKLDRPAFDFITGVPDNTVFNTYLSPKRMMLRRGSMLSAIMNKQRNDFINFETSDKNSNLQTVLGTEVVTERENIAYSSLRSPIAILENIKATVVAKKTFQNTLNDFNNGGVVTGLFKGNRVYMLPIGSMRMKSIMDDKQEWNLLVSPRMSYMQLLNLSRNGLTINLMKNSIFHSDYNTLHLVTYDFTQNDKYNFLEMYDDYFDRRNKAWAFGKTGFQEKFQKTEIIYDQIITNGVSDLQMNMYSCNGARLIDTKPYEAITPAPMPTPEIVLQVAFDLNEYPEDRYFFVLFSGGSPIAISERINVRQKWPATILIEGRNTVNKPGVFFVNGFKTIVRIEGLVKKWQPDEITNVAREESGDERLLYSSVAYARMLRFGNARGIPDYKMIKVVNAITCDDLQVEGESYTIKDGEKIRPSEDISGMPMYYYEVLMVKNDNSQGKVFAGGDDADVTGVILVVDASAIGIPTDQIIMIEEN